MKTKFFPLLMTFIALVALSSCSKDNPPVDPTVEDVIYQLGLVLPSNLDSPSFSTVNASFVNVATGVETKVDYNSVPVRAAEVVRNFDPATGIVSATLPKGTYNIKVEATVEYSVGNTTTFGIVRSSRENVSVSQAADGETNPGMNIAMNYFNTSGGFVIEEIFFTGTVTPENKQYSGDKYFKITNNSENVLYADGLALMESEFLTVTKRDYTPNIMSQFMSIGALYVVPGSGLEHPVEPGKSIVISDVAIDHREFNANSLNLGKGISDFEWYDDFSHATVFDTDNPEVPNMDKYYSKSATLWGPHNRGFTSYAIAKLEVDKETYLRDYFYEGYYMFVSPTLTKEMPFSCYKMPNEWIIDAVNLSVEEEFQWVVTDPSLDRGWSYCGRTMSDATRYGKAVRRKVESEVNGRRILKDSNNSTEDFDAEVTPSLMTSN